MAVAAGELEEGSAAAWARSGRRAWNSLPAGNAAEPWSIALVRLLFAIAMGLIALEVASYATGQYFDWNLSTGWRKLKGAGTYVGLYPGQASPTTGQVLPGPAAAPAPAAARTPVASVLPGPQLL